MHSITYIGITDSEIAYDNYPVWIKGDDPSIEIIRLRPENREDIRKCSGIVLSGGVDTHPSFYKNSRTDYPYAPEAFIEERDRFEMDIFRLSQQMELPLLAICRGMQLVNVCLGGTLIQDLEEAGKSNHRKQNKQDGTHQIILEKDSFLYPNTAFVNSAHHQGLDVVAEALRITAWSEEGVPEAVERKVIADAPYFLGVQWHPERLGLQQPDHVLTKNMRQHFLDAAKKRNHEHY